MFYLPCFFFLLAVTLSTSVTAANNTTPDPWNNRTGTSYTTIQAAIDDAQPGDTIIAETGTYTENIQINKKITLKAQGTPTIQAQNPNQPTITITADSTTITGFTIKNGQQGILIQAKQCTITKNNIKNNKGSGIYISSNNNTISGNNINNNGDGIYLWNSPGNTISRNNITNNEFGIYLYGSNNTISGNNINNNSAIGIYLYGSNNTISGNNINNNSEDGIRLGGSNNTISGNNINNNSWGIYLEFSSNSTISGNNINNNNWDGIGLSDSDNNTITGNNITNNKHGIYLLESDNNRVYRNSFIGNGVQATVESSLGNLFNLAKPIGGNFWSDYTGKDSNWDGFGDTPYTFTGGQDNLPIIKLKIISIDPANGTVSVPLNKTIVVTFNANIFAGPGYNKITVKTSTGTTKTITKSISGNKLYIKATGGWNPGVKFIITIPKNAVKNSAGSMLQTDFKSSFTVAIKVNSIDPANGAVNVPKTKTIIVTFSNNILAGPGYNKITVKTSTGTTKTITKTINGNKLYIKATGGWNPGMRFIITIPKNAVKNSAGSMLQSDFKSSFVVAR